MNFTCNQAKNDANILNRGLPLLAARAMFTSAMLVREDVRKAYPERRFVGYNMLEERLMVVVFCMPSDNHTHIISFRKANDREYKNFKAQTL